MGAQDRADEGDLLPTLSDVDVQESVLRWGPAPSGRRFTVAERADIDAQRGA